MGHCYKIVFENLRHLMKNMGNHLLPVQHMTWIYPVYHHLHKIQSIRTIRSRIPKQRWQFRILFSKKKNYFEGTLLCKFQWCFDMLVPNDVHIQYMTYRLCNNQYPTIHHNRTIIHLHNLSCCRNHLHPVHTCWSCCNLLKYLIMIFDWKMIFYDVLYSVL